MSGPTRALVAERITSFSALAALSADWEQLIRTSGIDPLCNGPAWVLAHAAAFARESELLVWLVRDTCGAVVALLPFKREPRRSRLALSRAQFLADGTFDSDYLDVPCGVGDERAVAGLLLDLLDREPALDAGLVAMVRRDSRFLAALSAELVARARPVRWSAAGAGALDLPDTFEAYVAALGSRMRSKVRQALRRAESCELEWFESGSDLREWLAELYELHGRRWRAAGRAGSFADERRRDWYTRFLPGEAERGALALCRLRRDGATLAVQLGTTRGATYYQVQEGYDPALEDERPGTQLRAAMVQELITRGVRRYDFMEGFTRHKAEWGACEVPCVSLSFALASWRGRAAFVLKNAVDGYRESSS